MDTRRFWRRAMIALAVGLAALLALALTVGGISAPEYAVFAVVFVLTVIGVTLWRRRQRFGNRNAKPS